VHLKSISLKGFKSFPDRTRLEFGRGVSVIVGPNGSGKSNVTDAVLWALGEQSPLAVRGQSMQDVIFGGARGQRARDTAEVELVLDNGEGHAPLELAEVSVLRRLHRNGEGEYRLNGARCRLVDVIEMLSDTGLGKEMHSVVSQGRVEAVISSKPRDRRLLIEEAAGLGKHRKRRRRAQLKLERTQENLDRALDVEREARTRLRPLKRQAEAAELHARLERQSLEARWELVRDDVRGRRAALSAAQATAAAARERRDEIDRTLAEVAARREAAEDALARRAQRHEALSQRHFAARSARERAGMRLDQARNAADALAQRIEATRQRIESLEAEAVRDAAEGTDESRIARLAAELEALDAEHRREIDEQLGDLERDRERAARTLDSREAEVAAGAEALRAADAQVEAARTARGEAERAADAARREAARAGAELAAVNHALRAAAAPAWMGEEHVALADQLDVEPGFEAAVAAALGGRLAAAVVADRDAGGALLDRAGEAGGSAITPKPSEGAEAGDPPTPEAEPLVGRVSAGGPARSVAHGLLADAWLVERLDRLAEGFRGIAVTREGRAWFAASGELRQIPAGGEERILAERNRRDRLAAASARAAEAERRAREAVHGAEQLVAEADRARHKADGALRACSRRRDEAAEDVRRSEWLIERRRSAPDEGPGAIRRAQVQAELEGERRLAARAERIRAERDRRLSSEREGLARDEELLPSARRLVKALHAAADALGDRAAAAEAELAADRAGGEEVAGELRTCAAQEAELQADLRERGEAVTAAEVAAQQARDRAADAEAELGGLAASLELPAEAADDELAPDEREALVQRVARLARRREQLGPVNPLAEREYADARAYVEELETQRRDLETAMRELRSLIEETDRHIREAFETTLAAAAERFEEVVAQLFPGGRGRLRLVREDSAPRPVLGGEPLPAGATSGSSDEEEEGAGDDAPPPEGEDAGLGVEIEMTPAGKSMKRLSLLSGGEKSLTALAFLFAIFLARPCPFYVLDEVEAALDDLNIDRFLTLLRRYSQGSQFIVVTHQKRTMEAADTLYGVSMSDDGVSRVISRRLPRDDGIPAASEEPAAAAGADAA
jgi:chromosome segregation protein